MGVSKNNGTPKSSILIGFSIIFTIHFGVPLFLETSIWHRYLLQDHLNQVFFREHFPDENKHLPTEGLEAEIFNSTELDLSHLLFTKMGFSEVFFGGRKSSEAQEGGKCEATSWLLFVMTLLQI